MPYSFPSLTPTYGLGSMSRTGPAILINSPRTRIGSQGRIYAYMKSKGLGAQYVQFLIRSIGPQHYVNPFSYI